MIPRLRRLLWKIEDSAQWILTTITGFILAGAVWLGIFYLLFAGEFK